MTGRVLTLHHGDSTMTFCPHIGASIARFACAAHPAPARAGWRRAIRSPSSLRAVDVDRVPGT